MRNKSILFLGYIFFLLVSFISCEEEESYCFKCQDQFATETFCYKDFKDDYSREEFKEMVFNLEAFGFTCKRE